MKCFNKSLPEYKKLLKDSKLKSEILDAKITVYQNNNNTDKIPTLSELNNVTIPLYDVYKKYNLIDNKDKKISYPMTDNGYRSVMELAKQIRNIQNDYHVKVVKAEDGNKGVRFTIELSTKDDNILFQKIPSDFNIKPGVEEIFETIPELVNIENKQTSDETLTEKLERIASKLGVEIRKNLENITDKNGNKLDVNAKIDFLAKIIEIAEGREYKDTLSEELVHFVTMLMGENDPTFKKLYDDIVNTSEYVEVVKEYSELYNNNERKLRLEAIGKKITKELLTLADNTEVDKKLSSFLSKFLEWIKTQFENITSNEVNPYKKVAQDIYNENLDDYLNHIIDEDIELYQNRTSQGNINFPRL